MQHSQRHGARFRDLLRARPRRPHSRRGATFAATWSSISGNIEGPARLLSRPPPQQVSRAATIKRTDTSGMSRRWCVAASKPPAGADARCRCVAAGFRARVLTREGKHEHQAEVFGQESMMHRLVVRWEDFLKHRVSKSLLDYQTVSRHTARQEHYEACRSTVQASLRRLTDVYGERAFK